jgi:DNA-binding response OmpR family regulator
MSPDQTSADLLCPCCGRPWTPATFTTVPEHRIVALGGRQVKLTPTEWRIFENLQRTRENGLDADDLHHLVYGYYEVEPNVLRVHISHLRSRLRPLGLQIKSRNWGGRRRGGGMRANYQLRELAQ